MSTLDPNSSPNPEQSGAKVYDFPTGSLQAEGRQARDWFAHIDAGLIDQAKEQHSKLTWRGSFSEYLNIVAEHREVARNAFQRLYDMVMSYGVENVGDGKDKVARYNFFLDPKNNGKEAVFGIDPALDSLVKALESAAKAYGIEKRVLLLHGPVGSAKSTIARLIKQGLERYSLTDEGALYRVGFKDVEEKGEIVWCPMNQDPLNMLEGLRSPDLRDKILGELNENKGEKDYEIGITCKPCPLCRHYLQKLLAEHEGDPVKVMQRFVVERFTLSESERRGIGTFQPKDEKNQDATELTGDVNYRKIAKYGADSDPRAFNFDGEFQVANRGMVEFIEVLKLDVAFLYDLLGASQEHSVKPKKFAQTDIDEVILGHTNEPEFRKLQNNEFMEALRDRTVKIDIPYVTKLSDEMQIYEKQYGKGRGKVRGKFVAPHTIEMASMWSVLTRLEEPKAATISTLQKLKLYNGKTLPGMTADSVRELREGAEREGMQGISPRYVQDKISNAIVNHPDATSLNPFMVLNELEAGLKNHSLIANEELKKKYRELFQVVKSEYEDIIKNEVQRAIAADPDALRSLCANYIDNVKAYTQKEKVKNPYTGQLDGPNERLMRSVEEKIDIPEGRKDDFRREIMNYIAALMLDGKKFDFMSNERLYKALELKLFEDQKDSIKLTSLVSQVIDRDTQAKIDVVKDRLVRVYGYDDESASDVLHYVASIFARGDAKTK